jgi:AcrR family transcriptional regulator
MVERIITAGARVLEDSGYQDASTNRIAREAGISPGSLYQYYPDKDAIVAEITLRLIDDFAAAITPALRAAATEPPPTATRFVLSAVLDALQQHTALLRCATPTSSAPHGRSSRSPNTYSFATSSTHHQSSAKTSSPTPPKSSSTSRTTPDAVIFRLSVATVHHLPRSGTLRLIRYAADRCE